MSDKIISELQELQQITVEIKRLNIEMKSLRDKKKKIEEDITKYLHEVDQPGVKYGDIVVLSKETTKRKQLKKKEKEANAIEVLQKMGIMNPKQALASIQESMRGEETIVESVEIKAAKK
jgi:predicted oxidoreductase